MFIRVVISYYPNEWIDIKKKPLDIAVVYVKIQLKDLDVEVDVDNNAYDRAHEDSTFKVLFENAFKRYTTYFDDVTTILLGQLFTKNNVKNALRRHFKEMEFVSGSQLIYRFEE